MALRNWVVAVVLLVAAVALSLLYRAPSHPENAPTVPIKQGASGSENNVVTSSPAKPHVAPRPVATAAVDRSQLSPVARDYATAKNLKAFFDKYETGWRNASPEVKHYLFQALSHCSAFVGVSFDTHPRPPLIPDAAKDRPNYELRLAALARHKEECAGFESFRTPEGMKEDLLTGSVSNSYPAGQARHLAELSRSGRREEAMALLDAVIKGPIDAEVVSGLASFASASHSDMRFGDPPVQPRHELLMDAWRLAMCDYGMDCGREARPLNYICIRQGVCDATSYADYVARFRYSPAEYEELARIHQQLSLGLAQRNPALLGFPRK